MEVVNFAVEHFRAIDAPESPLGIEYVSTGQIDRVEAHDEPAAAAIALSARDDLQELDVVSYNPGKDLYGVLGEDEAVRVRPA